MFGRKKKYYQTVLRIVHEYFEIETDRRLNPRFPSYNIYMDVLSEAYHVSRATVEEAAVSLVIGYWGRLVEYAASEDEKEEAQLLSLRILEFTKASEAGGKFNVGRAKKVRDKIDQISRAYGI